MNSLSPGSDRHDETAARASRAYSSFLASTTTLLLWEYVTPWAAWGWSVTLLVLALTFDFAIKERHASA